MKRFRFSRLLCASVAAVLVLSVSAVGASAQEEPRGELPAAYSSRDLGYVTAVKTQDYSSCWAFAGMATLESALLRKGWYTEDMSTDHLNLWSTKHGDGTGWQRDITTDGYPSITLGYLTSWQGGVFASDVSDLPLSNQISSDDIPLDLARYGVTSVRYLYKDDPATIKRCIMDNGGVYSSYGQTSLCMAADRVSYYMPPGYAKSFSGHSIEVVGWDDDYPREKFNAVSGSLPQNNGAWLIKNSWGTSYGDNGFFWMSYEDAYIFAQKYNPSYAFTGLEQLDGTKKLIQNEVYGATYEFGYIDSQCLTFLNHLTFDGAFDAIDKVMFKTEALGASYSIYYVPDGENGAPETDQAAWTKLYDGTVDYKGYLCADIEDFAYPGAAGSIAVTIDASRTENNSTIGVDEWLTTSHGYVFINKSSPGESYIYRDGQMQDVLDWYKENENDELGGTFVIKAITVKSAVPTLLGDANLDGWVDIMDVTEIQRHMAEYTVLTGTAAANADYNQDGVISIDDATALQRVLAEYAV